MRPKQWEEFTKTARGAGLEASALLHAPEEVCVPSWAVWWLRKGKVTAREETL